MTPEDFRTVLDSLKLEAIYQEDFEARVFNRVDKGPLTVSVERNISGDSNSPGALIGKVRVTVKVLKSDLHIATIASTFIARYGSESEISEEFLKIFTKNSMIGQIQPFIRQWVYDASQRLALVPLLLPLEIRASPQTEAESVTPPGKPKPKQRRSRPKEG